MTPRAAATEPAPDRAARAASALRLHDFYGRDLVFRYRLAEPRGYDYVSRSCVAMTGYTPEEFYADPELASRLVHPEDNPTLQAILAGTVGPGPSVLRWVRRDGSLVWTEQHTTLVRGNGGEPVALEGIARDVTPIAVASDAARSAHLGTRAFLGATRVPAVIIDPTGRLAFANETFLRLTQWTWDEIAGREWDRVFRDQTQAGPGLVGAISAPPDPEGRYETTSLLRRRDGGIHVVQWSAMRILDARGLLTGVAAIGEDRTSGDATQLNQATLATAVERANDSVMVTDIEGRIEYVNAAFEHATGYRRDEVIGRNPNILSSGHQSPGFYRAMWWMLTRGRPWRGEIVNRRKDGELLIEEATITPVRDASDEVRAYVAVKRDLTRVRQLRASLDDAHRQREILSSALERLHPRPTARDTCDDIASILAELPGVSIAAVALFEWNGARIAAAVSSAIEALPTELELPDAVLARVIEHPGQGPWVEALHKRTDSMFDDAMVAANAHAVMFAPIRSDGALLGVLVVGSPDLDGRDLAALQSPVGQVAAVSRTLLAPHATQRAQREAQRARVIDIITTRSFVPIFQPIVDLYTGGFVGFEALTRFDSGTGPAEQFAEAESCELGIELELATIEAAMAAAQELPAGGILTLNASPALILDHLRLARLLATQQRRVVLEVTEHTSIPDYAAFSAALDRIPNIRLAVDDAGAGTANLRHLVELQPDFVKLDISLVRDIDIDLTRQALVVGLKEFALVSGRAIIAEGIETELERTTLGELGIRFGQGYLLGAPAKASAWQHAKIESDDAWAAHPSAERRKARRLQPRAH
jgi:PAS domain S-box-containing protein